MKHAIEVSREDINRIIVEDLQDAFKWSLYSKESERELMDAIEVLLAYYMKPSEYDAWFQSRGRDQLTANQALDEIVAENQRLGLYDD